jgi:hypothetical protein
MSQRGEGIFIWVCSDKDKKLLPKSRQGLESSAFIMSAYVSDGCLKFLIKFRHLKELNLSGTIITHRGLTWILTVLCFTSGVGNGDNITSLSKQLVSFGFNYPEQSHINLVASEFQNLKSHSVSVALQKIRLTPLRDLKYLSNSNLRVPGVREEDIKVIGPQLKCLDIDLYTLSELKWIYDHCPRLQCLHVYFRMPDEPLSELKEWPPGF